MTPAAAIAAAFCIMLCWLLLLALHVTARGLEPARANSIHQPQMRQITTGQASPAALLVLLMKTVPLPVAGVI
jgi:hypothetical protein